MESDGRDVTVRTGRLALVTGYVCLPLSGCALVALLVSGAFQGLGGFLSALAISPIVVFIGWMCWGLPIRPRVQMTSELLVVVNPFRTYTIAWPDVLACRPGYNGVLISVRHRRPVMAWAAQRSNWRWVIRRRSRADDVADMIMVRAAEETTRAAGAFDALRFEPFSGSAPFSRNGAVVHLDELDLPEALVGEVWALLSRADAPDESADAQARSVANASPTLPVFESFTAPRRSSPRSPMLSGDRG